MNFVIFFENRIVNIVISVTVNIVELKNTSFYDENRVYGILGKIIIFVKLRNMEYCEIVKTVIFVHIVIFVKICIL